MLGFDVITEPPRQYYEVCFNRRLEMTFARALGALDPPQWEIKATKDRDLLLHTIFLKAIRKLCKDQIERYCIRTSSQRGSIAGS